jgi:hypothetical protein
VLAHPVVAFDLELDLVVENVLECRPRHDRIDPDTVDALALKARRCAINFDLLTGPVVAIAERFFDRLEVRSVAHDRLVAGLKIDTGFSFLSWPTTSMATWLIVAISCLALTSADLRYLLGKASALFMVFVPFELELS